MADLDDLVPDDHPAVAPPAPAPAASGGLDALVPEDHPAVAKEPEYGNDSAHYASPGQIARASLAPDPNVQVKRYAAMFKQPPEDFKVVSGDKIVRKAQDGTWNYVEPSGVMANLKSPGRLAASGAGQAIPMAAGTAGTMAGAALGIESGPGAVATAAGFGAAGAASGEVYRQELDKKVADDPDTPIDWGNVGWQALQGGITEPVGKAVGALGRLAAKIPGVRQTLEAVGLKTPADLSKMASDAAKNATAENPLLLPPESMASIKEHLEGHMADAQQAMDDAQALGIDTMTLGQATRSPTIQRLERWAAGTPEGAEKFGVMRRTQNEQQVPGAVKQAMDEISPPAAAERGQAVDQFREGAVAAKEKALDDRAALAGPAFKKALDDRTDRFWDPRIDALMKRPSLQAGLANAQKIGAEEGYDHLTVPTYENGKRVANDVVPDWRSWQYIKQGIDSEIESHTDPVTGRVDSYGRAATKTKQQLMGILTKQNPDWGDALMKYGESSDKVHMILNGGIKKLADMDQPDRLAMVNQIFSGGKNTPLPDEIRQMRGAFEKAGKLPEWDTGWRAYVDNALDDAMKRTNNGETGNVSGKMLGVWNTDNQRQVLTAAMGDPAKAQKFARLMDTLHHTASMLPEGSPTGPNTEFGKSTGQKVMGGVRTAIGFMTGHGVADAGMRALESHLSSLAEPAARKQLVDFVTSPNSVKALDQLLTNMPSPKALAASPTARQRGAMQLQRFIAAAGITPSLKDGAHSLYDDSGTDPQQ